MNRFAATTPSAIAQALTKAASEQMLATCPISGLVVPNDFPPYLGALFTGSVHPVVAEAINLCKLGDDYFKLLSNAQASGLLLSLLHSYNKLDLQGPAFLVRARLESTCTGAQLVIFIKWFSKAILTSKRFQPKLALSTTSDETTFDAYMKSWVSIERFYSEVDIHLATLKEESKADLPAFLSNASQAKKLNKACFEAWKEVSLYLPKPLREKMKPFTSDLAITTSTARIHNMLEAMKNAIGWGEPLLEGSEEVEALTDFISLLESKREEAKELGLDKTDWQFDDIEQAIQEHKVTKAVLAYHQDVPGLGLSASNPSPTPIATPTPTTARLSFSERVALTKVKKESN